MTLRCIALAVSHSLLALTDCHAGGHVGIGDKAPAAPTQQGSPS